MRIFYNFDTELRNREYKDSVQVHGKDGVVLIQRCIFYWLIKGIIPLLGYIIISIPIVWTMIMIANKYMPIAIIMLVLYTILSIIVFTHILYKYINYKMDFTLVTKEGISTYKQFGILNAKFKDLPAGKIRSVQSRRVGLLGNILNYGNVFIITDGGISEGTESLGGEGGGKIKLTFVKDPNTIGKKINDLCIGGSKIMRFKINDYKK